MLKAFVSYKWESDQVAQWAEKFATDLRSNGIDAKLDVWEVGYGDSFIKYMTRNIATADVFFFLMTPASIAAVEEEQGKGGAVNFEVEIATGKRIAGDKFRFIPILLLGSKPANFLATYRFADFRDPANYQKTITDLLKDIRGESRRPPILGAGELLYQVEIYQMHDPEAGDPFRSIAAGYEAFVGFPYFSYENDHPSQWPPRVDEDREKFLAEIMRFIRNPKFLDGIKATLSEESRIETFTSAAQDAEEQRNRRDLQTYMNLRMTYNMEMEKNANLLEQKMGAEAAAAFLDLEVTRGAEKRRMPNRLLKIAFAHSDKREIRNVNIDLELVATAYDLTVSGTRPFDLQTIKNLTISRRMLRLGPFPEGAVNELVLWYNFVSVSERFDARPQHFRAEPGQGVIIHNIASDGMDVKRVGNLIQDQGVYNRFETPFTSSSVG